MATPYGVCSECSEPLTSPNAKTCSPAHRAKRSRRMKRVRKDAAESAAKTRRVGGEFTRKDIDKLTQEVVKDELRPLAREAITEDVLRSLQKLVGLTPTMVEAIEEDLNSNDRDLRQRAYTLLARYTLGNSSVAPKPAEEEKAPMQVIFQMPRPGDAPTTVEAEPDPDEAVELRTCMECSASKPTSEFEGASERCTACHEALVAKVHAEFG